MPPPVDVAASLIGRQPVARARDLDGDPTRSIVLIIVAMVSFCCSDAVAKYLASPEGGALPAVQIAWMRWVGFVLIVLPMIVGSRGRVMRSGAPLAQFARGASMVVSAITFIVALGYLPMATATATAFAAPLFVTALSIPMLGERVGARRWAAVAVGLVGVLVIVRPGTDSFDPAMVFPLVSAVAWAFTIVLTRITSQTDGPVTTMCYGALIGLAALTFAVPFTWTTPTGAHLGWTVVMAATSTFGQFLTVVAYRRAAASVLVPFSYSQIIWSSIAGVLVFDQVPDGLTFLGAGIIVASGVYTAHRERVRAREALAA